VGDNLVLVEAPTDWNAKGNYKQVYFKPDLLSNSIHRIRRFSDKLCKALFSVGQ
jgi:hypothetical protein